MFGKLSLCCLGCDEHSGNTLLLNKDDDDDGDDDDDDVVYEKWLDIF